MRRFNFKAAVVRMLVTFLTLYLIVMAFTWWYQRGLLYMPDRKIEAPAAYDLAGVDDVRLEVPGTGFVQAWAKAPREGMPVIVFFHGNGGHLGYRLNLFRTMVDDGFGLVAVSYPGYGTSEGKPTETNIYSSARAAIEYAQTMYRMPPERMVFYGESLGTGVAVQMATEYKPGLVALQSPFTSIATRAQEIYFYFPVGLLIKDRFDSIAKIKQVTSPVLVMHGDADDVVPIRMGKALFEAANEPKKIVYFPGVGHIHFPLHELVGAVKTYAQDRGLIEEKK